MSEMEALFSSYITSSQQKNKATKIKEKYSDFLNNNPPFLLVYDYIVKRPEKYYSEEIFELYYEFLICNENDKEFFDLLVANRNNLNIALQSMKVINDDYIWHENIESADNFSQMLIFDTKLCPIYLKVIEGVYQPLIFL